MKNKYGIVKLCSTCKFIRHERIKFNNTCSKYKISIDKDLATCDNWEGEEKYLKEVKIKKGINFRSVT